MKLYLFKSKLTDLQYINYIDIPNLKLSHFLNYKKKVFNTTIINKLKCHEAL